MHYVFHVLQRLRELSPPVGKIKISPFINAPKRGKKEKKKDEKFNTEKETNILLLIYNDAIISSISFNCLKCLKS